MRRGGAASSRPAQADCVQSEAGQQGAGGVGGGGGGGGGCLQDALLVAAALCFIFADAVHLPPL